MINGALGEGISVPHAVILDLLVVSEDEHLEVIQNGIGDFKQIITGGLSLGGKAEAEPVGRTGITESGGFPVGECPLMGLLGLSDGLDRQGALPILQVLHVRPQVEVNGVYS